MFLAPIQMIWKRISRPPPLKPTRTYAPNLPHTPGSNMKGHKTMYHTTEEQDENDRTTAKAYEAQGFGWEGLAMGWAANQHPSEPIPSAPRQPATYRVPNLKDHNTMDYNIEEQDGSNRTITKAFAHPRGQTQSDDGCRPPQISSATQNRAGHLTLALVTFSDLAHKSQYAILHPLAPRAIGSSDSRQSIGQRDMEVFDQILEYTRHETNWERRSEPFRTA